MHSLPRSPAAVTDVAVAAAWPFPTLGCFFSVEKCAPSQPAVPSRCVTTKQSPPRASVSPLGTVPAGLGQQSRGWPSLKLHSWPPSTVVWPSPPRGRCKDRERGGRCQLPGCSGRRGRGWTRGPRGCAGWGRDLAAAFGGSEGPPPGVVVVVVVAAPQLPRARVCGAGHLQRSHTCAHRAWHHAGTALRHPPSGERGQEGPGAAAAREMGLGTVGMGGPGGVGGGPRGVGGVLWCVGRGI